MLVRASHIVGQSYKYCLSEQKVIIACQIYKYYLSKQEILLVRATNINCQSYTYCLLQLQILLVIATNIGSQSYKNYLSDQQKKYKCKYVPLWYTLFLIVKQKFNFCTLRNEITTYFVNLVKLQYSVFKLSSNTGALLEILQTYPQLGPSPPPPLPACQAQPACVSTCCQPSCIYHLHSATDRQPGSRKSQRERHRSSNEENCQYSLHWL